MCHLITEKAPFFSPSILKAIIIRPFSRTCFFATLNQEIGKRAFRKDRQHMNVTNLLRYESCFKDSQEFIDLVESIVSLL